MDTEQLIRWHLLYNTARHHLPDRLVFVSQTTAEHKNKWIKNIMQSKSFTNKALYICVIVLKDAC